MGEEKISSGESEGAFNEFVNEQLEEVLDHIINEGDVDMLGDSGSDIIVEMDDIQPPKFVYGDQGGNIMFQRGGINYANNSSDKSQGLLVAFIKNTTGAAIKYSVCMWYSSRGSSGAHGGIAVNSNNVWYHGGNARGQTCQTVSFPANKTSTLVNKSGCYYYTNWNGQYNRNLNGYYNNTWLPSKMPKGLEWDYDMYYKWMQGG